jgi:hypothetical protein
VKKLLSLLLLAACPLFANTTFTGGHDNLRFSLEGPGDNWKLAHQQSIENGESISEYIPAN